MIWQQFTATLCATRGFGPFVQTNCYPAWTLLLIPLILAGFIAYEIWLVRHDR